MNPPSKQQKKVPRSKTRARFITIEGADGAGKSTLLEKIQTHLKKNHGIEVIRTREPGGTLLSEKIRDLILDKNIKPTMHALSELFLYQAARAEHVQQKIIPAIKQGRTIFCDRFTTSTLAYQGAGRKLSLKLIHLLNDQATFGIKIDAIIWLKLDRKTAQERTQNRGQENRLDREKEQFHLAVMKGFELEYKKNKSKFIVLDAAQSPDDIFNHLIEHPLWKKLFSESRKKKKNEYQKN